MIRKRLGFILFFWTKDTIKFVTITPLSSCTIKMKGFSDMLMTLGDSKHTANFQKLCGIKALREHDASSTSENSSSVVANGIHAHENGNSHPNSTSAFCSNGSAVYANGSLKSSHLNSYSNGHVPSAKVMCNGNGSSHENGQSHKNEKLSASLHEGKNGFKKNGLSFKPSSDKSYSVLEELSGTNGHSSLRHRTEELRLNSKEHKPSHEEQSADVSPKYIIENSLFYYLFSFGAGLGNEIFYVLFFSFTTWNLDSYLVRKMSIAWVLVMYVGQAAKDVIRWPRPNSPPVVRLEERYELEYGMPSTHAMVGVAIPFGLLYFGTGRYEFDMIHGVLFAVSWSALVSCSRLYLGMHSYLDIVAGIVLAFTIMGVTHPFVDATDTFLMTHTYAMPVMIGVCTVLCLLYPSLDRWSTARGDTYVSQAVFSGLYAGMYLTRAFTDVVPEPDVALRAIALPDLWCCLHVCLRQVIGLAIVMVVLISLKAVFLRLICALWGLDPKNPNSKKCARVEFPYKYVSYFLVCAMATYFMPMVFSKVNISRPSYYSEVFNISPSHV